MTSVLNSHWPGRSGAYIYKFSYKFDTVLYEFLETETSDKTFMGCDHELK